MVEPQPSKLAMPVRSRSPAPRVPAGQPACQAQSSDISACTPESEGRSGKEAVLGTIVGEPLDDQLSGVLPEGSGTSLDRALRSSIAGLTWKRWVRPVRPISR